ncbi:MAG: hypothetical protein ACR2OU_15665 [Thermomicrobiales bacterium]
MCPYLGELDAELGAWQESDLIVFDYVWWAYLDDIWATLEQVRGASESPDVPIVLLSNRTPEVVSVETRLKNLQILIVYKPIDASELRAVAIQALDVDTPHVIANPKAPDARSLLGLGWSPNDHRYFFQNARIMDDSIEAPDAEYQDLFHVQASSAAGGEPHGRVLSYQSHSDRLEWALREAHTYASDHFANKLSIIEHDRAPGDAAGRLDPHSG